MNGRRAVIGLCMLCALLVSAIGAQSAVAKEFGTTAYTCKLKSPEGGVGFSKEHCRPADAVTTGAKFEHVEIPVNVQTELIGSNAETNEATNEAEKTFLKSTRAGIDLELEAGGVANEGAATMINKTKVNAKGDTEMYAEGEGKILYTGVKVKKPAGNGCVVWKEEHAGPPVTHTGREEIVTKQLMATTEGQPKPTEEMFLNVTPVTAPTFAVFYVTSCTTTSLNGTYEVIGTVKGRPDGATTVFAFEDTKKQASLRLGGQIAELQGKITLSARVNTTQSLKPISPTTSENT